MNPFRRKPPPAARILVLVKNRYVDGHETKASLVMDAPPEITSEWWRDEVRSLAGEGDRDGVQCSARIIYAARRPELVGRTDEWVGGGNSLAN